MVKRLNLFNAVMFGLFMFFIVVIVLSIFYTPPTPKPGNLVETSIPKALIVDSLGSGFTNKEGIFKMIKILYNAGFTVDVRIGAEVNVGPPLEKVKRYVRELKKEVEKQGMSDKVDVKLVSITVNFYKEILGSDYQVIVLRVHSTYTPDLSKLGWRIPKGSVVIITQERYDKTKYVMEQFILEQLLPSFTLNATGTPLGFGYFAFTENFIKAQKVELKNATIIVLGCHGLYTEGMARVFIEKGAIAYFGFDGYVTAPYADKVGAKLLEELFIKKKSIREAILDTIASVGVEPHYNSNLLVEVKSNINLDDQLWTYYFKQE